MEMDSNQKNKQSGQKENVKYVKTCQGDNAGQGPALNQTHHKITDNRNRSNDTDTDLGRPKGILIPGEQVSGDNQCRYQEHDQHPGDPHQLPGRLVSANHKGPNQVQSHNYQQNIPAVIMDAFDHVTKRYGEQGVINTVVSRTRSR